MELLEVFWHLLSQEGVVDGSICQHCLPKFTNTSSPLPNLPQSLNSTRTNGLPSLPQTPHNNLLSQCSHCNGTKHSKRQHYIYDASVEFDQLRIPKLKRDEKNKKNDDDELRPVASWSSDLNNVKSILAADKKPSQILQSRANNNRRKGVGSKTNTPTKSIMNELPNRGSQFIMSCFQELNFSHRDIAVLGKGSDLNKFINLESISLTGNKIELIKYLPPKTQVLNIYANKLRVINLTNQKVPPPLIHMGLGYNQLTSCASFRPLTTLISLDLSCNQLSSVRLVTQLTHLVHLRHLRLAANPLCLSLAYPYIVSYYLPQLQV